MTEHVKTEIAAGIMTLTLARADKKNALSNAMYSAMSDGLERAEKDPSVRVVLFQGDGDSFTAGNDLADFSAQANGKDTGESQAFRFIRNLGFRRRPRAGYCLPGSGTSAPTRCLRSENLLMQPPPWPAVWPTPWCRQRICAPGLDKPPRLLPNGRPAR